MQFSIILRPLVGGILTPLQGLQPTYYGVYRERESYVILFIKWVLYIHIGRLHWTWNTHFNNFIWLEPTFMYYLLPVSKFLKWVTLAVNNPTRVDTLENKSNPNSTKKSTYSILVMIKVRWPRRSWPTVQQTPPIQPNTYQWHKILYPVITFRFINWHPRFPKS